MENEGDTPRIGLCLDMCIDMYIDMYIGMYRHVLGYVYIHVYRHVHRRVYGSADNIWYGHDYEGADLIKGGVQALPFCEMPHFGYCCAKVNLRSPGDGRTRLLHPLQGDPGLPVT